MPVRYVNLDQHININYDRLPHWQQFDAAMFVTFRLRDSLPQSKIVEYREKLADIGKEETSPVVERQQQYDELTAHVDRWIDSGYGSCNLRQPIVRQIVADALNHADGTSLDIYAYVIMPNHVHLLLAPRDFTDIRHTIGNIKRFTALRINRLLGRNGSLWQSGQFDTLVRSALDFQEYMEYIIHNPAHLPTSEYTIWISPSFRK